MTTYLAASHEGPSRSPQKQVRSRSTYEDEDEDAWDTSSLVMSADSISLDYVAESEYIHNRNRQLIGQLLDLQSPVITESMSDLFAQEGAVELLATFISDATAADRDLRRSRTAARLLCTSDVLAPVVDQFYPMIAMELARILEPESDGPAITDFVSSFNFLFRKYSIPFLGGLFSTNFFINILHRVDYSPLEDLLCMMLVSKQAQASDKLNLLEHLNEISFFDEVAHIICQSDNMRLVAAACHVVSCVCTGSMSELCGDLLARRITQTSVLIESVMTLLTSDAGEVSWERKGFVATMMQQILHSTCKNYKQFELVWQRHLARTTGIPNVMMVLATPLREALFPYIPALVRTYCEADEDMKAGVKISTVLRLNLLQIITETIRCYPDGLHGVQDSFWLSLCDWFFASPNCNMQHNQFSKLVYILLSYDYTDTLRLLCTKGKLVSRLIKVMEQRPKPANRGVAVLMANWIRLYGDIQAPSNFLPRYLKDHHEWQAYMSTFRQETVSEWMNGANPREAPHIPEIDAGSVYALSIGVVDTAQETVQLSRWQKRKQKKASKKLSCKPADIPVFHVSVPHRPLLV